MQQMIFSVYDAQAKMHMAPFTRATIGLAERDFKQGVNDPNSQMYKTPEDFTLWHVGYFDDETGDVIPLERTVKCAIASALKDQKELKLEAVN